MYSLLASRKGPLATEYTDTRQNAESSEVSGNIGGDSGVVKASTSSTLTSTQTRTTQVLRKSTIQAAFKELLEGEQEKLAVVSMPSGSIPPSITTWSELEKSAKDLVADSQWVIDPQSLARGRLFELAIELAADEIYRMTSIVNEVVGIVSGSPQLFPVVPLEVQKVASINRVLDSLLVGLIPLRCRVIDYRAVELEGKKLLIHTKILENIPISSSHEITDIYVAGVTEERLFWKDVRRVLFSGLQFRAMCRANAMGLQDSWVPVKLFDVLRDVTPDLASDIEEMTQKIFAGQQLTEAPGSRAVDQEKEALIDYGLQLAREYGGQLDRSDLEDTVIRILEAKPHFDDIESIRIAFSGVTSRVSDVLGGITIDAMVAAQVRSVATLDAGIGPLGSLNSAEDPKNESNGVNFRAPSSILDVEIVAIYW